VNLGLKSIVDFITQNHNIIALKITPEYFHIIDRNITLYLVSKLLLLLMYFLYCINNKYTYITYFLCRTTNGLKKQFIRYSD